MVRLEEFKAATEDKKIEKPPLPSKVYIPLLQHLGKISVPCVQIGDPVFVAQKIAVSSSAVSANIHSSVSGRVSAIQVCPHPVLGKAQAIIIESDGLGQRLEEQRT